MFGIGAGELLVIFIIAIVVIGPKQLPDVARTIGKLFATFKRTTNQLRDQMQSEVQKFHEMEEVKEFKSTIESEMYNMHDVAETYVKQEIESQEQQLVDEARNMEQAFTAEGGPEAPEPAISPPESDPSASLLPASPGEASGEPAPVSLHVAAAEAEHPAEEGFGADAAGGNGSTPAHAKPTEGAAPGEVSAPVKPVS